jgi:tetratricopeptide (TPR) repeat protein
VYKSIWIILPTVLFFLFSNASAQQKEIRSENAEFHKNRGPAYLEKCQCDKAILDFKKALKMNPDDAHAHYNRGRTYGEQGRYELV